MQRGFAYARKAPAIGDVIARRMARRGVLRGLLGLAAAGSSGGSLTAFLAGRQAQAGGHAVAFTEIAHGIDDTHHVAPGHRVQVLLRWGDPILPGAPPFDPERQSRQSQGMQFGYNCDFIGFVPLPFGSGSSRRGLLCVNHEYTIPALMFPDTAGGTGDAARERTAIEIAAHGVSVVEVARHAGGDWRVATDGGRNRRITADTPMAITGPAAGHARLRTRDDPSGTQVLGTLNNCAGGVTPWGTYLAAEENFHGYFGGSPGSHAEGPNHKRYDVPGGWYPWHRFHDRFDVGAQPNEPNRFGWVVEIDPLDAASTPKKRTALGRFKHEGAMPVVTGDGRVAVYSADDEPFEYLYRFVSAGRFEAGRRDANMDLLDDGILSVARFHADGSVRWLPLVFGTGPLTPENGFHGQADVLIEARRAADLLGATPMDRPEDVEPNPVSGKVYVMLSNNPHRSPEQVNAANPRPGNRFGHIIEITPDGGDHAAGSGTWDILVLCGDPARPEVGALWGGGTSRDGWFACPDNCAVDGQGRLWVTTDQGKVAAHTGTNDGVWSLATDGDWRGTGRMFFRAPVGAEACGPCFTPDDRTLFVSIQHPATDSIAPDPRTGRMPTYADPATRWPDFLDDMPPRPSVVAITRDDGGVVGG